MNAKIGLEDVRFFGPHGFYDEEHLCGNEFSIDAEVESNVMAAATGDDLGGTVNYSTIYYLIQAEMKKPTKLLEALAYRIAARIQQQFTSVTSVKIKLRKLHPPLGGQVGAAFVEINLGSGGMSSTPGPAGMPASPFGNKQVFDELAEDYDNDFDPGDEDDYFDDDEDDFDYD